MRTKKGDKGELGKEMGGEYEWESKGSKNVGNEVIKE